MAIVYLSSPNSHNRNKEVSDYPNSSPIKKINNPIRCGRLFKFVEVAKIWIKIGDYLSSLAAKKISSIINYPTLGS